MKARELRRKYRTTGGGKKQPCFVCGHHESITELHHVFPLKDCATFLEAVNSIEVPLVWLCPNCHTYVHQMYKCIFYNAMREMPRDEYLRMFELVKQRYEVSDAIAEEICRKEDGRMMDAREAER